MNAFPSSQLNNSKLYARNIQPFYFIIDIYRDATRRQFLKEILYKNIAIIAIQHGKFILLTPLAIFPILLSEIHSSPSGKFPCTYELKLYM